jgi:8-oxo-dGTP diphosphatase
LKKILLLKRSPEDDLAPRIWDYIGGRLMPSENPEETLLREIMEETGIKCISIVKPINISKVYGMIIVVYWCKTQTSNIELSSEHTEFKWIDPEEALTFTEDKELNKNIQRFLEEKKLEFESNITSGLLIKCTKVSPKNIR